jgi:hypothetical protein
MSATTTADVLRIEELEPFDVLATEVYVQVLRIVTTVDQAEVHGV